MSPPTGVAEKLCCTAEDTDSRSGSPLPFRRHSQPPSAPGSNPATQQQQQEPQTLPHHRDSYTSPMGDGLLELQQIFAEAGSTLPPSARRASSMTLLKTPPSRPATATEGIDGDRPKKMALFKRLTRDLSKSNLSLSNLRKTAAARDREQKEQHQQNRDSDRKAQAKNKGKDKAKGNFTTPAELNTASPETGEVLLSQTYDSDAASLTDIRDSVVEHLTKTVVLPNGDKGKARMSPVRSKRSTDRRGDVSSIDWGGKGAGEPYGWSEPSSSAPVISLRIPEHLSDLGILPSCNVSVEDLRQLYQPSGRGSPWKKLAEQHLPKRSKSAESVVQSTPNLNPMEIPGVSSSFNSKAWRTSTNRTAGPRVGLSAFESNIPENQAEEQNELDEQQRLRLLTQTRLATHSTSCTPQRSEATEQAPLEVPQPAAQNFPSLNLSAGRRASVNLPPSSLINSESASVHLHDMRISQHLRSESTLSGVSHTTSGAVSSHPHLRNRSARGSFPTSSGFDVQQPHAQHRDHMVVVRALRGSSSGFASERIPEGWGNVVSAVPSSVYVASEMAYEPSSIYSTRQNSMASTQAASKLNSSDSPSTPGGSGHVRKAGYEVLNLADVESLRVGGQPDKAENWKEGDDTTMPGAFPQESSMPELIRADTGLTFTTAIDPEDSQRMGVYEYECKHPSCQKSGSSEQAAEAGEDERLRPEQQVHEQMTDSSLDITPITAVESPLSNEKTPQAQNVTPLPSKEPSSAKKGKKTSSVKNPSKRFSTFSFLRSKTYANLRRASHNPAIHASKTSKSEAHLPLDGHKGEAVQTAFQMRRGTDGPSDSPQSGNQHRLREHPDAQTSDERHTLDTHGHGHGCDHGGAAKDSMASEAIEEHRLGRLSRSWLISDDRDGRVLGQNAVWEKALQKHHEERNAMFLSPEKGGKSETRGLFRERSGSGSAISTKSKQSDRKGKGPAIGLGFSFGERSPGLQRSPTVMLDPLDSDFGEELARQREKSNMHGDDLRQDRISGSPGPTTGMSPCASLTWQPNIVSIEPGLHIGNWGGTTLPDIDLGGLGAWGRYPSHTREQRTGPAGATDDVRTRDFAYEPNPSIVEDGDSTEGEQHSRGAMKRLTALRSKKKSTSHSGMSKSKSMTFSRNFGFLKHYIGLFRSQSEEFRKHGHGHRSSIAEGGTLEHPELEMLPPVFSPVTFNIPDATRLQTDGANSRAETSTLRNEEHEAGQPKVEDSGQISTVRGRISPSRRQEANTDSSDGSWTANARIWTHAFENEPGQATHRLLRKADSSSEWWNNARTWTRYSSPSQEWREGAEDGRQKTIISPIRLARQGENSTERLTADTAIPVPEKTRDNFLELIPVKLFEEVPEKKLERSLASKHTKRAHHTSSDEWRSDARLFSQMYEACVQVPTFGSSEDANACATSEESTAYEHEKCRSGSSAFRVASTGHLDGILAQAAENAEKAKRRAKSGSYSNSALRTREALARNHSFLSVGGVEGSAMDLMRFLHDLEEGESARLQG
ncbi:hypothetical protein MPH_12071 [Macrophomina phaseolina MS6]|uniref:Uncharacterized protein n=1 Tax=Macrophomina phaseolina (strain MS6) TaxID=1126212 RepID=K2S254_MACPH|nr:hypothetical protein MPH_12071 [Macrophomina phaseolina MS6]